MKKGTPWFEKEAMPPMKQYHEMCMDDETEDEIGMPPNVGCNMLLAHSYVPWQIYKHAFSCREALMRGTLFPELWGVYPIPE